MVQWVNQFMLSSLITWLRKKLDKQDHIFSLIQYIFNFSTMYGHQAAQKKKIGTLLYLGLRYQCITYVLCMYRHKVGWHCWCRDLLWAGWPGV
jgi:hypothetical protein